MAYYLLLFFLGLILANMVMPSSLVFTYRYLNMSLWPLEGKEQAAGCCKMIIGHCTTQFRTQLQIVRKAWVMSLSWNSS